LGTERFVKSVQACYLNEKTYVMRPDHIHRPEESDWDFVEFLRTGNTRFQSGYRSFTALE